MKQKKKRKLLNKRNFYGTHRLSGKGCEVPGIRIMLGAAAVIAALALFGQSGPSTAQANAEAPQKR
jgi:hypothetical protein